MRRIVIRRTLIVAAAFAGLWATPAHASTWCGTPSTSDRLPNLVAGYPVHAIYAIPSDGTDRFAEFASVLQTDAEAIDGWWRGQDPTRTVRWDTTQFSCGAQLDISSVRLPQPSSQLAQTDGRFLTIAQDLEGTGLVTRFGKYVVYYDGPVVEPRICGTGGGSPLGPGIAIVWLAGCQPQVPYVTVAAHELIHALGAVAVGAPHMCPAPNDGHTCDVTQDIMYPFADGSSLGALLLDPGRDDYYGHSGTWWDVQDSPWLIALNAQVPLGLSIAGTGSVTSDVPGVLCNASCTTSWNAGTTVTLTPTAGAGQRFLRWSGACSGTTICTVTLGQAANVTATFGLPAVRLSISVGGKGSVRAAPIGLVCATTCSTSANVGERVTLTAKAAKGWRFKTWTGGCSGKRPSCSLPMATDTSARAVFVKNKK